MNCDIARLELFAYHRGELADLERATLEAHLDSCETCRDDLTSLADTAALVDRHLPEAVPPGGMKEGALALVEAERVRDVLVAADLHAPPDDLKARALGRLSDSSVPPDVRAFPSRVVSAALAVAAVVALVFALTYRAQLAEVTGERDRATSVANRAERQVGPAGHPMQTLGLTGPDVAAEVALYHFRHDNYRVVLVLEEIPVTPTGHHYEVWLTGSSGEVSVGSFRIKSEDRFTNSWVVGVDPRDFPNLVLTVEPNDGDPAMAARVVARAVIDRDNVYHGRYDE